MLGNNTRLVFVGIGRSSAIAVFRIVEGVEPALSFESMYRAGGTDQPFSTLLENKNIGNLDPEDLR